jgi:chromatin segregation and condensation protein Rec8/ScpA/Scc1 (kleisin family)
LVVAFLSVLELVRMSEISLVQNETFGEIMARAASPEPAGLSAESG